MTTVSAPLAKLAEVSSPATPQAEVDDLDLALLRALATDARQSQRGLARKIEMSPPAVADRLARLERSGAIRGIAHFMPGPLEYPAQQKTLVGLVIDHQDPRHAAPHLPVLTT